ncbi:MAG: leucyl/phenylalanyl-tRNA--protein transferase [Gammaproteobacteria bacterium]
MFVLNPDATDLRFPPVELASPEGLLAIGGDLRSERLLEAYRHGIFPWYNDGQPILWWSPDPRAVLFPARLHVSRSLRKTLRRGAYRVTFDERFREVMQACAAPRAKNPVGGTWITAQMLEAYTRLHQQGYAHSVEAWDGATLVGGLYGVAIGGAFFGESMFSRATDASKVAFVCSVRQLQRWGFTLIDCQLATPHLASLGAESVRRRDYLNFLAAALRLPHRHGPWRFDDDLAADPPPAAPG